METLKRSWPVILIFIAVSLLGAFQMASSPQKEHPAGWTHPGASKDVCALTIQGEILWAGGMEGLWPFEAKTGRTLVTPAALSKITGINGLLTDSDGKLWIATDTGLYGWENGILSEYTETSGLPDRRVTTLAQDKNGVVWIGTWGGLATLNAGVPSPSAISSKLANPMVSSILFDSWGRMWIGSAVAPKGGLTVVEGDTAQIFAYPQLPHNNVNCMLERSNGEIWVGTGFSEIGGLAVFRNKKSKLALDHILTVQDGLAGEKIRSLWESSQGTLLIGTEYDGVTLWKDKALSNINMKDGLRENEVKQWLMDSRGTLWLGTRLGVTCIRKEAVAVLVEQ